MCQCRFADRKDVEADIKALLVVNDVPAVEDRGWLGHGVKDLLKVKVPVHIPLGQYGNGVASLDSPIVIF